MTATDPLAPIRARAEAATPGPWEVRRGGDFQDIRIFDGSLWIDVVDGSHQKPPHGEWIDSPDIDFIAHARTDVPALLATIDAVLALHVKGSYAYLLDQPCEHCGTAWPCPTVAAVSAALGGGE